MSIRIHELAKKLSMDNKDLLALLKERGYPAKSVSSTVDNITAEALEQEIAAKNPPPAPAPEPPPAVAEPAASEPAKVKLPAGVFVKSAQDIQREKDEAAKAAVAARAALNPPAAPAPVVAPRVPMPPPAFKAPPLPPSRIASPVVGAPKPAPVPVVPAFRSAPGPAPTPAPVAKAPMTPPPVPGSRPPLTPAPAKMPPLAPPPPAAPSATTVTITEEGGVKIIHLKPPIIVRDFAVALGLKPFKLISELMEMSIFASMNQSIDEAVATKLAEKHGFLLDIKHRGETQNPVQTPEKAKISKEEKAREEDLKNLAPRPPVVCILGHVDHGKTSLLDAIRKANVAAGEAGGITQHIGAYQIEHNNRKITFLDTPGHAAFTKMRARGASVTDIAVLVVAADDGFMPQTDEALKHALDAKVALMVAVNKMDVKGANLDRVKQQMQERQSAPEDWGGETVTVPVAAIKGQGITELLEMILLQADVLELKANPKTEASGVIV
ncbi:MAG TPA: translation initiation factor IF-2 N-terminal domain-containing protein, partial [Lacunisphaera sp.]|nr:translation initiation factor IF-2 N-terminal domain-containing protein [Lacunisphaera sp.]